MIAWILVSLGIAAPLAVAAWVFLWPIEQRLAEDERRLAEQLSEAAARRSWSR